MRLSPLYPVALADVPSKAVVLLLLIDSIVAPIGYGFCV